MGGRRKQPERSKGRGCKTDPPEPAPKPKPAVSRADLALFNQAFSRNWPIPNTKRTLCLDRILKVFDHDPAGQPVAGNRTVIAAFRALTSADRINIAREAVELDLAEFEYRKECHRLSTVITTDAIDLLPPRAADRMLKALLHDPDDNDNGDDNF